MRRKIKIPEAAWRTATGDDSKRTHTRNAEQVDLQLLAPGKSVQLAPGIWFSRPIPLQFDPDPAPEGWREEFGQAHLHPRFGDILFHRAFFEGPTGPWQTLGAKEAWIALSEAWKAYPLLRPILTSLAFKGVELHLYPPLARYYERGGRCTLEALLQKWEGEADMNRQGHAGGRNWSGESLLKRAIARVTIPQLWTHFTLPGRVKDSCCVCSPFRDDRHPSFSIFAGGTRWKDHGTGEYGDSFAFYCKLTGLSAREAFRSFVTFAGLEYELSQPRTIRYYDRG